ncbi:MAG: hypothetical protein IID40_06390 [Planctomycetes bacterium]|nr:hypothetical protein [Planctomycetota bacterium]
MSIWKNTTSPLIGREGLADGAFAESLSIDKEHRDLALSIRRAVAKTCGVEAKMLYPSDLTSMLADEASKRSWWRDWDYMDIVFALEDELGRILPGDCTNDWPPFMPWKFFWWKGSSPAFFGEWVEQMVAVLHAE